MNPSLQLHPEIDAAIQAALTDAEEAAPPPPTDPLAQVREGARALLGSPLWAYLVARYTKPVPAPQPGMTYGEQCALSEGRRMALQDVAALAQTPQEPHHGG